MYSASLGLRSLHLCVDYGGIAGFFGLLATLALFPYGAMMLAKRFGRTAMRVPIGFATALAVIAIYPFQFDATFCLDSFYQDGRPMYETDGDPSSGRVLTSYPTVSFESLWAIGADPVRTAPADDEYRSYDANGEGRRWSRSGVPFAGTTTMYQRVKQTSTGTYDGQMFAYDCVENTWTYVGPFTLATESDSQYAPDARKNRECHATGPVPEG